jgi:hypothetical protein
MVVLTALFAEVDRERRRARESYDPLRVIASATLVRIGLQPLFAQQDSLMHARHVQLGSYLDYGQAKQLPIFHGPRTTT